MLCVPLSAMKVVVRCAIHQSTDCVVLFLEALSIYCFVLVVVYLKNKYNFNFTTFAKYNQILRSTIYLGLNEVALFCSHTLQNSVGSLCQQS